MRRVLSSALLSLTLTLGLHAQTAAPDAAELSKLLNEFLVGASRNDAAMHERFWAEDLIYTGSSGRRVGKADIMRDVRSAPAPKPGDPKTVYAAEDVRIQQYDKTAVVAFRLVGTTERGGATEVASFLNTGTFLKRGGKWQVVNWTATKLPRSAEDAKKEVAAIEAAFHQAMLASDVKKLESLTDESFVWTQRTGEQTARRQLLEQIGSGQLKYSKLETRNVVVSVYGDAGVVRGVSPRQRNSIPATPGTGDAAPFDAFYTLTFVNQGGTWKAVAMHTSRP
ncbi:MAG TPA: nuclear transport factor 2 family protein [Pyrinomonadaceae bacterium]|nr:nuclear transport factor 2 family protein [Pyrinomonadaceae bacterium]